jgi:hypothetical protein
MARFMLFMHDDAPEPERNWGPYLRRLRETGRFEGGTSLGAATSHRRDGEVDVRSDHVVGYLIVAADDRSGAEAFLVGNPVYEAGGTVEIRELVED